MDATNSAGQGNRNGRKPLWQRPLLWLAGLAVAALGAFLTDVVADALQDLRQRAASGGPPVTVSSVSTYRSDRLGNSVAFPRGTTFDDSALAELNQVRQAETAPGNIGDTAWLESRGGAAIDSVFIELVLTGGRPDPVRILDVDVAKTCGPPHDGLLFLDPPAGADDSIKIFFDLDDPDPEALVGDGSDGAVPYFPDRTISLAAEEQQVVLVEAQTGTQSCSFTLELTVLDRGTTTTQQVTLPEERPFTVTASVPETSYEQVYLGGVACPSWVRANDAYFADDYALACDGD